MSSTNFAHSGDDYVTEVVHAATQTAEIQGHIPVRVLRVALTDGQIINDGQDTETVAVDVVDGLEVVCGTDRTNATVLEYDGDVILTIDGVETAKTLTGGTIEFDISTDKPSGTEIEIVAESLADHPAESDRAEIEVIQG